MVQAGEALRQAQQGLAAAGMGQEGGEQAGRTGGGVAAMGSSPESGRGTTNEKARWEQMGSGSVRDRQSSERSRKRFRFERIYAPQRVASRRIDTQVRGRKGQGPADYTWMRAAPDRGAAYQPYYEVYSSYRRAAEDALSKEDVPAAYRKQVRDYFDSLRP